MEGGRTPVIEAGVQSFARRCTMWIVRVSRLRPGQLEPEAVVATTDPEVARKVIRLIRESLAREEGHDEPMTKLLGRIQTDD
jgi:hypothetical protein